MKNHFLDAFKGLAKLFGMVLYIIGYPFYKTGNWLLNLKSSRDKMLEEAIKQAERRQVRKPRTPKKKDASTKEKSTRVEESK